VGAAPDAVAAFHVFRDDPLQPHQTGMREQLGADLADLKWRGVDALRTTLQQLGQAALRSAGRVLICGRPVRCKRFLKKIGT
jgi:hypothetical protein